MSEERSSEEREKGRKRTEEEVRYNEALFIMCNCVLGFVLVLLSFYSSSFHFGNLLLLFNEIFTFHCNGILCHLYVQ